jgi:hypothetical protein
MESCQKVAGGNYLLVQMSGDVFSETYFSKGGKGYFFPKMTSLIGLCVPQLCQLDELMFLIPYFQKQAVLYGFLNDTLDVSFHMQKNMGEIETNEFGFLFGISSIFIFAIFVLICFGTIVELTQIGNRGDILVCADPLIVNSLNYKDVNRMLLF